jgi:hypothetical protein
MTARKHHSRVELQKASATLLVEVLGGKWSPAQELLGKPIAQWAGVIAKLEEVCPGHSNSDYVAALIRANRDNR